MPEQQEVGSQWIWAVYDKCCASLISPGDKLQKQLFQVKSCCQPVVSRLTYEHHHDRESYEYTRTDLGDERQLSFHATSLMFTEKGFRCAADSAKPGAFTALHENSYNHHKRGYHQ